MQKPEVSARGETARGLLKVGAPMEFGRRALFAAFVPGHPIPPRIRLFVDFVAAEQLGRAA